MKRQFPRVRLETSGSGTDEDPYQKVPVQAGRRRRALKGGGAPGYKGSPPPSFMKGILSKIVGGLAHKLRAGMKSKLSFMVGVGKVISGLGAAVTSIFAGEEVHTELLLASLYLVITGIKDCGTRDAGVSSQDEGTRKDISPDLKELEAAVGEVIKKPLEILPD